MYRVSGDLVINLDVVATIEVQQYDDFSINVTFNGGAEKKFKGDYAQKILDAALKRIR